MPSYARIELDDERHPTELVYAAGADPVLLNPAAQQLKSEIDGVSRRINLAFPFDNNRLRLYERLRDIARFGLLNDFENLEPALSRIENFHDHVTTAALQVRQAYLDELRRYIKLPIAIGLFLVIVQFILILNMPHVYDWLEPINKISIAKFSNGIGGFGFVLIGLCIGATLSSYLSNREISFDNFDKIRRYNYSVSDYFFYLYFLSAVVFLVTVFNVIIIGIGNIHLNEVQESPVLGIFIGLICGISESGVAKLIVGVVKPEKRAD